MSTIQVTKAIHAPIEQVFAAFSDLEKAGEVITDIVKMEVLTDAPMGVGTRWRETRIMFKKEATEEMEITAFDPPNSYTAEAESHGSHYFSEYRFIPSGDGVEVTMTFRAKPLTLVARIMGFILAPMMRRTLVNCLAKDMDELKSYLESGKATEHTEKDS